MAMLHLLLLHVTGFASLEGREQRRNRTQSSVQASLHSDVAMFMQLLVL
jgi:hypothetical protein